MVHSCQGFFFSSVPSLSGLEGVSGSCYGTRQVLFSLYIYILAVLVDGWVPGLQQVPLSSVSLCCSQEFCLYIL